MDVTVYNAIVGMTANDVYDSVKASRKWKIVENDISKRGFSSKMKWLYSSIRARLAEELFKRNIYLRRQVPHGLTKGYVLFPAALRSQKFDYILIHLVDSLPFAVGLKSTTGGKLIYDCQEYFRGQYATEAPLKKKWVDYAEDRYAGSADIVLATTNVMLDKLKGEYSGPKQFLRVRNTPAGSGRPQQQTDNPVLRIIWHGFEVVPKNIRGVHILVEAVAKSKTTVHLYLQGRISETNRAALTATLDELGIRDRVFLVPAAHPDRIVESLAGYDIGVAGELATQDNQRLTSSNKLFEYINAGLAVIVPDLPGLAETIHEYGVGLLYKQGDSGELAEKIDALSTDRSKLDALKAASVKAASTELFWENDYKAVWRAMQNGRSAE
ncbi:glycosyltransferase family 4 protein [Puia sp. P3]|uniref:glycosyltransferase family 4 protein n=1 Tax=Puia sp. P3 TaxID=3423952 RepID=UPI003D673F91